MEQKEKIEQRGRKWKISFTLLILVIVLTATETILYQLRTHVNISDNVLILVAVNLNIILLVILILLVLRNLVKLYFERKRNVLGAKFRTKLILSFIGFSLIPCVLLFLVASNLINTSIESWFSAQNEEPLRKAMKVAQIYYDTELGKAFHLLRGLSGEITEKALLDKEKKDQLTKAVEKVQEGFHLAVIKVYTANKKEIVHLRNPRVSQISLITDLSELMTRAFEGQEYSLIRKNKHGDQIDGVVPILSSRRKRKVIGALVFSIFDPHNLMEEMNDIKKSYEEYKQRKVLKTPLKGSYIITFLLITLLIIFSATWFGIYLAKGITIPIQMLAEGTREVALGNLKYKVRFQADDEIGMLIDSFNNMTDDLYTVHQSLQNTNWELDQRRDYIETVLENIASGVITIGKDGAVTTINKAAGKILALPKESALGVDFKTLFDYPDFKALYFLLNEAVETKKAVPERELQLVVGRMSLNLLAGTSVLFDKENNYRGTVCAFDDLTQLIKAQKVAAWQEVARRLAHEIKNPLTPIMLCTQRLRKKYFEGATQYKEIFEECTETIIQEVNELKNMIDEFSRFARMPEPYFKPEDLHQLIITMIDRYKQMYPEIQFDQQTLGVLPLLHLDREQVKRVFINLLDNAIDALSDSPLKKRKVWVVSLFDQATSKVRIEIIDNGKGISPEEKTRLFVPYFSTKKEGRGLGLAIVHRIITDHNGTITIEDNHPNGTKFILAFPAQQMEMVRGREEGRTSS